MLRSLAFFLVVLALAPGNARGFHHVTPTLLQITPVGGAGTVANQRWAGIRYVIFDSDGDLLGSGSTGRQVFLFDLLERDFHHVPGLVQLTDGTGDHRRATTGKLAQVIVYDEQPIAGGPRQLVVLDRRTGERRPLTAGAADSRNARMDDASRIVVFESAADFFGTDVPGTQIYQIDLRKIAPFCPLPCASSANAGLTQLTRSAGTSRNAVTATSGKLVAFESDADPMGIGERTLQIYTYDRKTASFAQLSHGPGASRNPSISANGGWVAFESETDLLGTGTLGTQIFVRKRTKATPQQISDRPIGHCTGASVSANGHAVGFVCSDDLLSSGSTGPEVFSYDLRHRRLRQITDGQNTVGMAAYAGGVFVTFLSDGDPLGNGTAGTALYLANLYALGVETIP